MRILIWCDTYYQLVSAVHLRSTIFSEDVVDVVVSDHSLGAEDVVSRLRQETVFENVMFAKTKKTVYGRNKARKLGAILTSALGRQHSLSAEAYDEIVFYGLNPWLYGIGDQSVRLGRAVSWSRFDEGILSYETDFSIGSLDKLVEPLRTLAGMYRITEKAKRYYCYFPGLKDSGGLWDVRAIPPLDCHCATTIEVLKRIFNYKGFPYNHKFIFFASSSDIDGRPFGETEIVLKIAEHVGEENLLVKMHPRDTRDVYRSRGISVMEDSQIPWEVVQLCTDMSRRSLLTISSGAFLSVSAMDGHGPQAAFLVPESICDSNLAARMEAIKTALGSLHRLGIASNIEMLYVSDALKRLDCGREQGERAASSQGRA